MSQNMKKKYVAVIQAGGKGTRMQALTENKIPKPMLTLNGKPMLQWQIENLSESNICDIVIILGHLGKEIRNYFGDGQRFGVRIRYIEETETLGSAGALIYLKNMINDEDILLIFGDVMFDIAWKKMLAFHEERKSMVTILAHPNEHPYDSDLIITDDDDRVTGLISKSAPRTDWYCNLVNAGISVLNRRILDTFAHIMYRDFENDILLPLIPDKRVYAYITPEYVKDAGTPERFHEVCAENKSGLWKQKNLDNLQKCIFLDRDGTVNIYRGLISREEDFELEDGVANAIRKFRQAGYLVILVTNQSVVARGLCGIKDVERIHMKLQTLLGEQHTYLDDIVFCPHHPDRGYPEENPVYKIACNCRKPSTGMIEQMVKKYNIDLSASFIIGDSTVDIQTGKNAGMKTILLSSGYAGQDKKYFLSPDFYVKNLSEAAAIVREYN